MPRDATELHSGSPDAGDVSFDGISDAFEAEIYGSRLPECRQ